MRLIDADVMDQGSGNIPPLEVRLDLQPGDRVGLYQEVRHSSMGAGFSPLEAIVLGSPEPGWFIGETEDGQEITFHAGNVADVQMGSPQMGGIFDWFRRLAPPDPGRALVPIQPPQPPSSQLPVLPAGPEERKGLISKLKTFFDAPFGPMSREMTPAQEKKSIFDIFRKQEVPPGKAGLPVERAGSDVTRHEKKPSMFSFLDPEGPKPLAPFFERASSIVLPEKAGPLAPYIEKALEPFVMVPKSPEPEPYEIQKAKQKELWSGMFQKEEEKPPLSKMFEMFPTSEVKPYDEIVPKEIRKQLHRKVKVLPMPRRQELLPSLEDVARGFMGFYKPIDELWDSIREARNTKAWQEYVEKYGFAKEPFESIGNCGGPPELLEELAYFLNIPWEEFRNRAAIENVGTDEEEWVDEERIWLEIVLPAIELMTQALNMMKPEDLPGHFIIEKDDDHGCMLVLTYVEGEEKEDAEEQWEAEEQKRYQQAMQSQQEQEERSPQEIAQEIQDSIVQEEEAILKLTESLENLMPNNPEFKAIAEEMKDNLQKSKDALRSLTEELSNLPGAEKARRSPTKKKKAAKRGGKKKK